MQLFCSMHKILLTHLQEPIFHGSWATPVFFDQETTCVNSQITPRTTYNESCKGGSRHVPKKDQVQEMVSALKDHSLKTTRPSISPYGNRDVQSPSQPFSCMWDWLWTLSRNVDISMTTKKPKSSTWVRKKQLSRQRPLWLSLTESLVKMQKNPRSLQGRPRKPSRLGNPFGIPRNSVIIPILDLLDSGIFIGI